MITAQDLRPTSVGTGSPLQKDPAVRWWALVGVAWSSLCVYSVTRWLLGGFAHSDRLPGPDGAPHGTTSYIWVWFGIFYGLAAVAFYVAIVKPWQRERRLTADGYLLLSTTTFWCSDPGMNYFQQYLTYNQRLPNLGCPMCFFPGYNPSARHPAEGPWTAGFDFGSAWIAVVLGGWVMCRAQQRWPQRGWVAPVLSVFAFAVVFDLVTEILWVMPGMYVYTGVATRPVRREVLPVPDHRTLAWWRMIRRLLSPALLQERQGGDALRAGKLHPDRERRAAWRHPLVGPGRWGGTSSSGSSTTSRWPGSLCAGTTPRPTPTPGHTWLERTAARGPTSPAPTRASACARTPVACTSPPTAKWSPREGSQSRRSECCSQRIPAARLTGSPSC